MSLHLHLAEVSTEQVVVPATGREPDRELIASVRRFGVLMPIDVRANADGRYELTDGSRRVRAALQVGLGRVRAVVEPAESAGLPAELKAIVLNTRRQNLQQLGLARHAQRLLNQEKLALSQAQLAREVGISPSLLCRMLKVLERADLVRAVERDGLEFGAAKALLPLGPLEREALLAELRRIERASGKLPSVRQVEELVRRRQGQAPLTAVEPEQLAAVVEALLLQDVAVEIRTVRGKASALKVTLALTEADSARLRALLSEAAGDRVAGTV